jgi:hypothetical protein
MATAQRADSDRRFEVLTRRPDGHETVHRIRAKDAAAATAALVDSGVPQDQVVEVVEVVALN